MLAQTYLLLVAQELEENQRFAEQVAVNGFNLVHAALKPTHVLEYWYRLLVAYSELQTFTPQIHPDAYLLAQSILGETTLSRGIEIPFKNRTCIICKQTSLPSGSTGLYYSGYFKAIGLA